MRRRKNGVRGVLLEGTLERIVYMVEHHEEPDVPLLVELAPGEPLRTFAMLRPFVGSMGALSQDLRGCEPGGDDEPSCTDLRRGARAEAVGWRRGRSAV